MPKNYRKSSHSVFSIELHIVWITKYRYHVLTGDVALRTRNLIRRICTEENAEIIYSYLKQYVSEGGSALLVSHDSKACDYGTRLMNMSNGRIH